MSSAKLRTITEGLADVTKSVKEMQLQKTAAESDKELLEALRDIQNDVQHMKADVREIKLKQRNLEVKHAQSIKNFQDTALTLKEEQEDLVEVIRLISTTDRDVLAIIESRDTSTQEFFNHLEIQTKSALRGVQLDLQKRLKCVEERQVIQ